MGRKLGWMALGSGKCKRVECGSVIVEMRAGLKAAVDKLAVIQGLLCGEQEILTDQTRRGVVDILEEVKEVLQVTIKMNNR